MHLLANTAQEDAAALLEAAVTAMQGKSGGVRRNPLPEIQAVRDASPDLRRELIVLAAQDDRWPARHLLTIIADKPAGLTGEHIEALLVPLRRLLDSLGGETLSLLIGQVEATWKTLDSDTKARLGPKIEWIVTLTGATFGGNRLRKLVATGDRVPYELIGDTDHVGKALRAVLAASPESDGVKTALLNLLTDFPATGKPGKRWVKDAIISQNEMADPITLTNSLLGAANDADDYVWRRGMYRYATYARPVNEAVLCGLACLAGQVGAPESLPLLRALALKAGEFTGDGSSSPRSLRLANICVQAIADAALPASLSELAEVERATRHGTVRRRAGKAIAALLKSGLYDTFIREDEALRIAICEFLDEVG